MSDETDYHPKPRASALQHRQERFPPRVVRSGPPPGEDYFALTGRHGRPHGVFNKERELPYGKRA
jgi:hypothetical protein